MTWVVVVAGCAGLPSQDRPGRPIESVADEIVAQVPARALVLVGERHQSVLTGLLPRLVERGRVECLLFEAPQELVRGLDGSAPFLRGDPSVQSFVRAIAAARRSGARTYGVDRPPPLLGDLSFDDWLVDRNLYMAASIHHLFASGECGSVVYDDTRLTTRRVEGVRFGRTAGDELPCVEVTAARHWADGAESEASRSYAERCRARAAVDCR